MLDLKLGLKTKQNKEYPQESLLTKEKIEDSGKWMSKDFDSVTLLCF